jgi:Mrp family chromosome partitioning ATPase
MAQGTGTARPDRLERALERSRAERELRARTAVPLRTEQLAAVGDRHEPPERTRSVPVRADLLQHAGILDAGLTGLLGHGLRVLRAMVLQRLRQRGWNTVAVLSPAPNDGKTFVATNLAIAIAAERDSTALLVDVDLRSPSVHTRFGLEPEVGIEDCLAGRSPVAAAMLAPEPYPGLVLLPARAPVPQSSELLGGLHARALFRELKQRYANRYIIYDLPPMLAGDDALVFASQADAALVVVGDNRTHRHDLLRCLEMLGDVPVLGTVLNGSLATQVSSYPR